MKELITNKLSNLLVYVTASIAVVANNTEIISQGLTWIISILSIILLIFKIWGQWIENKKKNNT
jgi:hypothetical protein